jgi:hypothetical protein
MMGLPIAFGDASAGVALAALNPEDNTPGGSGQVNSNPLGALTGAPPRTRLLLAQIVPGSANQSPTVIAPAFPQNRVIVVTAPLVSYTIFVGDGGVRVGTGLALPPGYPYEIIIPGLQQLYAITNAPGYLPLQIQDAALLVGDKERRV